MTPQEEKTGQGNRCTLELPPEGLRIRSEREPVRFVLTDCFKMAFAVGAGLTIGIAAAIGALALSHTVITAAFSIVAPSQDTEMGK